VIAAAKSAKIVSPATAVWPSETSDLVLRADRRQAAIQTDQAEPFPLPRSNALADE